MREPQVSPSHAESITASRKAPKETAFLRQNSSNGDDEVRTHDPHNAIVVLFQLSYVPEESFRDCINTQIGQLIFGKIRI